MRTRRQARIEQLVPIGGDLEDLVEHVARSRGRSVCLLPTDVVPEAPSGVWVATDKADYIAFPSDAPPTRRAAIICHELAHMLLGHAPQEGGPQALARLAAPAIAPDVAARFLLRHHYVSREEREAETLATRLVAALTYGQDAPQGDDRLR